MTLPSHPQGMQDFHYEIIPLHHSCPTKQDLLNTVFEMWENTFGLVLSAAGAQLDFADFFRCHSAGVIMHKNEIIGFNLFTAFDLNLNAHLRHPYLSHLDADSIIELKKRHCTRVMTMEYFTVSFSWRKRHKDIPWSEILTGLGLQYLDQSTAHGILGTPRMDLKVDEMCRRLGATPLQPPIKKMNYDCAVVLFEKNHHRHFTNPMTHFWVKKLWKDHAKEKHEILETEDVRPRNLESA